MQKMLPEPLSGDKPGCTQACEKPPAFPRCLSIFFRAAHPGPQSQFLSQALLASPGIS